MIRMLIGMLVVGILGTGLVFSVQAEETDTGKAPAVNEAANAPKQDNAAEKLKTRYHVDDQTIQDLRARKMGYGEITNTLSLAETLPGGISRENIDKIADMRTGPDKKGWGEIARQFNTTVGEVRRNAQRPAGSITEEPKTLRHFDRASNANHSAAEHADSSHGSGQGHGKH